MEQNAQEELKAHLMQTNEEFRELVNRHHEFDVKVEALEAKSTLTPEEELEEHRLKKLKLHLKDEIQQFMQGQSLQPAG
jgi:uncharacterized protein YdcH (DUF465 family)